MNIALCSPNKKAYSETFIQAHKTFLKGNIHYYYHGKLPTQLEGGLVINSRKSRIVDIFKGHLRLNKYSLAQQALITSFKVNKIDIVFAEYGPTGTRILPVCKALDLPLIVHFHGADASNYEVLENNENYSELFEYAGYVIAVSRQMYSKLLELGCPKEKLVYNVYGPRDEFFEVSPDFKKPQFISIGRFVDKKAPYYLILSLMKVLEKHPDATLIMAGNGNLLNACKNLVDYYNLEENIHFPGVISADEFRGYLRDSLALLQHSIRAEDGDMEGTPLSILEAGAAGLPVISTYHAGIPDVVIHGKNGLLVQEHDVDGMAEEMSKLLREPEKAKEMGARANTIIREKFTLERHINLLNNLIQKVLKKK